MTAFEAELYLRLAAERALPTEQHYPAASSTAIAAGALVAAGVLTEEAATAVLKEYGSARALRGRDVHAMFWHMQDGADEAREAVEPFEARRTFMVGAEVEHSHGRLRVDSVSFGSETTVVSGALKGDAMAWHSPPALTVVDDSGTRETAEAEGAGWDEEGISGRFCTTGPLDVATAWIEIDGQRMPLGPEVAAPEARIEALPQRDPALRYLWQRAVPDEYSHEEAPLESAIAALIAAGALAPDHPDLEPLRAVASMLSGHGRSTRSLPEPFRSLRRHGQGHGPEGSLVIGAVTPVFDGFALAIDALESTNHAWTLSVRVAPGDMGAPFDVGGALPAAEVAWWAADDRGHTYLGRTGNWEGHERHGTGTIHFEGGLDRKAAWIELQPTVSEHRAVIRVPLEWA